MSLNESIVENAALEWFGELGYAVGHGPHLAPGEPAAGRILAAKQENPTADTSALEREIDQQVYALYGLTPDEIAIVEGTTK